MRIGILGSGVMGTALAARMRRAGHDVFAGTRRRANYAETVRSSEIVFLALAWPHGLEVVRNLDLDGRILVDVSNPESEDGRELVIGFDSSGAEEIARVAPGARVLKAFNHFYAELLHADEGDVVPSIPYCGDDAEAKVLLGTIIRSMGLDGVDAGPLRVARYLEPFAMLTVQLVRGQGWGPRGIVWRLVRNGAPPSAAAPRED